MLSSSASNVPSWTKWSWLGTENDEFYQLVLVLQCFQYVVGYQAWIIECFLISFGQLNSRFWMRCMIGLLLIKHDVGQTGRVITAYASVVKLPVQRCNQAGVNGQAQLSCIWWMPARIFWLANWKNKTCFDHGQEVIEKLVRLQLRILLL